MRLGWGTRYSMLDSAASKIPLLSLLPLYPSPCPFAFGSQTLGHHFGEFPKAARAAKWVQLLLERGPGLRHLKEFEKCGSILHVGSQSPGIPRSRLRPPPSPSPSHALLSADPRQVPSQVPPSLERHSRPAQNQDPLPVRTPHRYAAQRGEPPHRVPDFRSRVSLLISIRLEDSHLNSLA